MNKYLVLIFYVIFFVNGCDINHALYNNFIKRQTNVILLDSAIENIIIKVLKSNNTFKCKNTLFFIDIPINQTNIFLDNEKLINLIKIKFKKHNETINFLDEKIIKQNKKKLGISNIDNNLATSTAILLSRNNHVKYYLRSAIFGKHDPYSLKMELVLVKTGEIIFTQLEKFYWEKSIY